MLVRVYNACFNALLNLQARLKCSLSWVASMLQGGGKLPGASSIELSLLEDPFYERFEVVRYILCAKPTPAVHRSQSNGVLFLSA